MGSVTSADERPLRPGDVVEVRSAAEILATLDGDAALDKMPFMPEMVRSRRAALQSNAPCGQDLRHDRGHWKPSHARHGVPRGSPLRWVRPRRLPGGLQALLEGSVASPRRRQRRRGRCEQRGCCQPRASRAGRDADSARGRRRPVRGLAVPSNRSVQCLRAPEDLPPWAVLARADRTAISVCSVSSVSRPVGSSWRWQAVSACSSRSRCEARGANPRQQSGLTSSLATSCRCAAQARSRPRLTRTA